MMFKYYWLGSFPVSMVWIIIRNSSSVGRDSFILPTLVCASRLPASMSATRSRNTSIISALAVSSAPGTEKGFAQLAKVMSEASSPGVARYFLM